MPEAIEPWRYKAIRVWRFEDAPPEWQALSTNGGDEDWIAFVPECMDDPLWIEALGRCCVDRFDVERGRVFIGSHA